MRKGVRKAFTLVELVIVIAIIGILAAIAIPRFIDIRNESYTAQRDGIVGSVRAGVLTVAAKNHATQNNPTQTFPPDLEQDWGGSGTGGVLVADVTACSTAKACLQLVTPGGITAGNWVQTTSTKYTFTNPATSTAKTYTYSSTDGTLQ